jgi:hypothetical protein
MMAGCLESYRTVCMYIQYGMATPAAGNLEGRASFQLPFQFLAAGSSNASNAKRGGPDTSPAQPPSFGPSTVHLRAPSLRHFVTSGLATPKSFYSYFQVVFSFVRESPIIYPGCSLGFSVPLPFRFLEFPAPESSSLFRQVDKDNNINSQETTPKTPSTETPLTTTPSPFRSGRFDPSIPPTTSRRPEFLRASVFLQHIPHPPSPPYRCRPVGETRPCCVHLQP